MTMSDDQLDVLLRRADPLTDAPRRSPAEIEAALQRLTAIGPGDGRRPRRNNRPRRRLALRLAPVGLAGAAAVALIISATSSTPPAYALTSHADGSITITLNDLTTGIPALNARLKQMGINETVIPVTKNCPFTTPVLSGPGPGTDLSETITIGPKNVSEPAGVDAYLAAEQLPDGSIGLGIGGMKAPLPSCISPTLMKVQPSNTPDSNSTAAKSVTSSAIRSLPLPAAVRRQLNAEKRRHATSPETATTQSTPSTTRKQRRLPPRGGGKGTKVRSPVRRVGSRN